MPRMSPQAMRRSMSKQGIRSLRADLLIILLTFAHELISYMSYPIRTRNAHALHCPYLTSLRMSFIHPIHIDMPAQRN